MNTIDEFITLVQDELGLPVTVEEAADDLDLLAGWDSLHMLSLLSVLEMRTGRQVSLPDALEATSLQEIYILVSDS